MLGALFLVALQLLGKTDILVLVASAWTRSGYRMRLDAAAFDADEHLRRGTDNRSVAHPDEIHVRRRVHMAERAIHGERIRAELGLEPLRQDDLIDIAGRDVLLGGANHLLE